MKHYKKRYEAVFTKRKLSGTKGDKCDLTRIKIYNGMSLAKYAVKVRNVIDEYDRLFFEYAVKIQWLFSLFVYNGHRRVKRRNGFYPDMAFGVFMRSHVGRDNRFYNRNDYIRFVITYLEDFFPNFLESNPFEQEMKYPYEYVPLCALVLVYQMKERLELLDYMEKNKLSYAEFADYVLNYVNCYNEEHCKTERENIYEFSFFEHRIPYVINQQKGKYNTYEEAKARNVYPRRV